VVPATSVRSVTSVPSGDLPAPLVAQPARLDLLPVFRLSGRRSARFPLALVEATCWWESGWQEDAVSATGAVGLCQIEPSAPRRSGGFSTTGPSIRDRRRTTSRCRPLISGGSWTRPEDDRDLALAGYYQGLTSVKEHGILAVSKPYVAGHHGPAERLPLVLRWAPGTSSSWWWGRVCSG
jgi:hypothetical protein